MEDAYSTWDLFLKLPEFSMSELDAYCRLTSENIAPWQVDALIEMNKLRRKDYSKGR